MTLEQLVKSLSEYLAEYPKCRVIYNLEVGISNSMLIWDAYPEMIKDGGERYIVVTNKRPVDHDL